MTVILLRRRDNDAVVAAIWHYACHATAVVPSNAVSADFPGAVRRALRQQFGEIPCVFAQGFCGDISPKIPCGPASLGARLRWLARLPIAGPGFPSPTHEDYKRWSESLAAAVARIAHIEGYGSHANEGLAAGAADVALAGFFNGRIPDKPLAVRVMRFGERRADHTVGRSDHSRMAGESSTASCRGARERCCGFMPAISARSTAIFRAPTKSAPAAMR